MRHLLDGRGIVRGWRRDVEPFGERGMVLLTAPRDGRGKAFGVSLRSVQRLWEAHRLQPHRIRTFKSSSDPKFAGKVEDVVGLYMSPPAHAVVVSIDEKSQLQVLNA